MPISLTDTIHFSVVSLVTTNFQIILAGDNTSKGGSIYPPELL